MKFLKNVSYTIASNILSIFVSTMIVLVVPKFLGVHEYGLWQLFIFYENYVSMLHLGWADGVFLRRGGQQANDVDVASLKAETVLFALFNICIGMLLIVYGLLFSQTYHFIITALGFSIIVANIRTWVTMILQAVGDFRGYAINLSVQSIVYLILIFVILLFDLVDYRYMIVAFLISQLATSISGFIQLKKLFKKKVSKLDFSAALREAKLNIDSGFKLMIANSTAMLIVGVIRFGIQQKWSIATFGKISLVLSIANLITVFINAVSLVLFPTLRRTTQVAKEVYVGIRNILMPFLYITILIYFPIKIIIPLWLPKYADVMQFTSVLMPMMVYQGKFEILSNTFMKNFRMEATLMLINVTTLLMSIGLTGITVYLMHNISLAVFSIAVVMGFRSVLAEVILSRRISVPFVRELLFENVVILGFMILSWNYSTVISFGIYAIVMVVYLFSKRQDVKSGLKTLRVLSKY
ncbi:lipopolysaccharide biosynthesis protein [Lactiplantibacillus pingfangensis]|uniref:lipopolysaccharide biosynthesis protein n=1 Tax=Lactiplantibacillus pingfangensis TaxID=2559915 RepID=UPI0010F9D10E|nr:hypothetical protein [Lactiplantibacillus pingfangensis]